MRHSCDLFMIDWHFLDIRQQTFTCIYHVMLWVQNKKELNEIMSKIFHFYLNEVNLIVFYSAYHIKIKFFVIQSKLLPIKLSYSFLL